MRGHTNLIFNVSISALMMQAMDKQIRCGESSVLRPHFYGNVFMES